MKGFKSTIIQQCQNHAEKEGGKIFYTGPTIKFHVKSSGKDERLLIITDLFISYYNKKGENSNTNYWIDLKSISIKSKENHKLINLTFDQDEIMKFEIISNTKVDQVIFETIKHASPGGDVKIEGRFSQLTFSILPRTIYNHFLSQVLLTNNALTKQLKDSIKMIFRVYSNVVGFTPAMVDRYFPFLIKSLGLSNYLESIRIPELDQTDVYSAISEFLQEELPDDSCLYHLSISKSDMKNFSSFCESFSTKKSPSNKISSFSFVNSEFGQDDVKCLSEAIGNSNAEYPINSVCFDNAANSDFEFVDSFFANSAKLNLKLFSMSRMRLSDVKKLASFLPGIRVLSLSYMNLEVSQIFEALSNSSMNDLNYLNVSGNFFNVTECKVKNLPTSIQRLDANEVNFYIENAGAEKNNSLVEFFLSVLNKKWNHLIHFSFSHIFCHNNKEGAFPPDKALEFLFTKLKKCKTPSCEILKGLSFSGNFVDGNFFDFVKKCRNLRSLFINFCLSGDSPYLDSFCASLKSLKKLSVLSVKGDMNQKKVLGEKFPIVCKAIKKCKSLSCLILSENSIGNKGIELLGGLFESGGDDGESNGASISLSSLCFDSSGVDSIDPLVNLAEKAISAKRPILLDFPVQDIWRLKESQTATKEQINDFRNKLQQAYKKQEDGEIEEEIVDNADGSLKAIRDYWKKAFSEYKVQVNDFFPEYISPTLLSEMDSPEPVAASTNDDDSNSEDDENGDGKKKVKKKAKSDADEEEDEENEGKSKSKKKKSKIDLDSDEEDDDRKIMKKKKSKIDLDSDEDDDDDRKIKKKKSKIDLDSDEEDDDRKSKKKKKSKIDLDSDDDEDDDDRKSKKKKSKNIFGSDDDEDEEDDDRKSKKKKKSKNIFGSSEDDDDDRKSKKKKKSKIDLDSDDDDEFDSRKRKRKSKRNLDSDSFSGRASKKQRKSSRSLDSVSDDDYNGRSRKKSKRAESSDDDFYRSPRNSRRSSKRKGRRRSDAFSNSDSESDKKSGRKSKKSNKSDDDGENGGFVLSINPQKEKEMVKNIKKKFSINRLQDEIINNQ